MLQGRVLVAARLGTLLGLLLAAGGAQADIYTYTSNSGMKHFSNVRVDDRYQLLMRTPVAPAVPVVDFAPAGWQGGSAYDPIIDKAARLTEVPAALLRAVIAVESGFDPKAVSHRGAVGLMQLMPATARRYGVYDASDPIENIHGGARYLGDLARRFDNDLELVLAAYNAGEGAVERAGNRVPPFQETQRYVPSVLRLYRSMQAQENARQSARAQAQEPAPNRSKSRFICAQLEFPSVVPGLGVRHLFNATSVQESTCDYGRCRRWRIDEFGGLGAEPD